MSSRTDNPNARGWAERGSVDQAFAAIIAANGNSNSVATTQMILSSSGTANQWEQLRRILMIFLTTTPLDSPLATITAAQLTFTPSVVDTDTFTQHICLTSAIIGAAIGTADYEGTNASKTEYATRIAQASMTAGVAAAFTFNAAGLAYLNTQFGAGNPIEMAIRWSCDIDEVAPTWSDTVENEINFNNTMALAMTYSVGPGNAVVSLTGQLANAADTVNCNTFIVEVFP